MEEPSLINEADGSPKSMRQRLNLLKPILEALNEDGSINTELLKQISQGCFRELNRRHLKKKNVSNLNKCKALKIFFSTFP